MSYPPIIDALYSIPRCGMEQQISECVLFSQDLAPKMDSAEIAGAVVGPCNCERCQHQWNCADRRTHEVQATVKRSPKRLRGLACYDQMRIGESLRWIDEGVTEGGIAGAYTKAECSVSGLDASRMYPLYGMCAKLRSPLVIEIAGSEGWRHHRPQVEVIAADFPELDILLAPPAKTSAESIVAMLQRFPRIAFLLCPEELQRNQVLRGFVEFEGREHVLFRAGASGWAEAIKTACSLGLGAAAQAAYFSENCMRLFNFPVEALAQA